MREIVRFGEVIIFDDVETNDGEHISLSVAQYIDLDLQQDGLHFSQPLYQQMLDEVLAHQGEPGFKAETYFCRHSDPKVSQLATRLALDRHQLGGRFVMQPREDSLRQRVLHLVMDFRLYIIEQRLKRLQQQLRQASNDMDLTMRLLKEHKDTKELRDMLAKKLGSDLVV
jgi:DNA primase